MRIKGLFSTLNGSVYIPCAHSKERELKFPWSQGARTSARENGGNTVTNRHLDRIRFCRGIEIGFSGRGSPAE